ncbi:MAG: MAPEG family protein [Rhizobiaceae bacterium]|nr:MAPEG family protein [Rhizobiaceae bacterium]
MDLAASTEVTVLGWSVVLLLLQVVLQAGTCGDLGFGYLAGPRDEQRQTRSVLSQRLGRALKNLLETFPAFVALALALAVTGRTGGLGAAGAWLYLIARIIYVPLYAAGIPLVRSLAWLAAMLGLVLMLVRLMA